MAKASKKTKEINNFINAIFGVDRVASIKQNVCTMCGKYETGFRDDLSQKEYSISGMCQECQDKIYGTERREI